MKIIEISFHKLLDKLISPIYEGYFSEYKNKHIFTTLRGITWLKKIKKNDLCECLLGVTKKHICYGRILSAQKVRICDVNLEILNFDLQYRNSIIFSFGEFLSSVNKLRSKYAQLVNIESEMAYFVIEKLEILPKTGLEVFF